MLFYLCGAIEYSPDHGKAWREEVTRFLHALGHQVYDPALDEKKNLTDEEVAHFRSWKATDLPRFQQTVRKIIQYDLDWVEHRCDAVIALWDEYAPRGAGTQGELTVAHRRGIPVYLVTALPTETLSGWILGCASRVFTGFEELRACLESQAASRVEEQKQPAAVRPRSMSWSVGMNITKGSIGWIEVVCGPMFSGKSEELIRRLRRAEIARQRVQIFKPAIDQRYADDHIVSHSDLKIQGECVKDWQELERKLDLRTEVVGIDEAQFLGDGLVGLVVRLADMGKRVIVAGLDTDYLGRPFHPMPELLAVADEIVKMLAICMQCGNPAKHTQRLVQSDDLVVVGGGGTYEARCRRCFEPNPSNMEKRKAATTAAMGLSAEKRNP